MTPQEKAKELINKFQICDLNRQSAAVMSIICVEEMIKVLREEYNFVFAEAVQKQIGSFNESDTGSFWIEVMTELLRLS